MMNVVGVKYLVALCQKMPLLEVGVCIFVLYLKHLYYFLTIFEVFGGNFISCFHHLCYFNEV